MASNVALTPPQEIALEALLCGATQAEAAKQAGVDKRTISRWHTENEAFRTALKLRADVRARFAQERGLAMIGMFQDVLAEIAQDHEAPPAVRVQACNVGLSRFQPKEIADDNPTELDADAALDPEPEETCGTPGPSPG